MLVKMKDICTKVGSGATPKGGNNAYIKTGITLIRSQNIHDFYFSHDGLAHINDEQAAKLNGVRLEEDDVLLNITGDSVARACKVDNSVLPARVNQHVCIVRGDKRKVLSSYVLYYLQMKKPELLMMASSGATRNALTKGMIEELELDIPSLQEQKKIVSLLDDIQCKISNNNRINRNLSEQASAYYENWKMSLTGEAVELSKVIDVRDGTHASPKPQDEGYPLVTSKHLFEYDVDLESPNKISQDDYDKTNERSKVEYHDVLMSMIGTVGVVSFISRQEINFAIKNVALFRTSQREELAYYVLLFLKSKDTKQYIKSCMAGSTQQYISLTELRKIPIIVPGEEIKEFNLVIKPIIDMICANVIENRRLSELRDTLLPKLMSGELDVSNLDI